MDISRRSFNASMLAAFGASLALPKVAEAYAAPWDQEVAWIRANDNSGRYHTFTVRQQGVSPPQITQAREGLRSFNAGELSNYVFDRLTQAYTSEGVIATNVISADVLSGSGKPGWVIGWHPKGIAIATPDGKPAIRSAAFLLQDWRFAARLNGISRALIREDPAQVAAILVRGVMRLPLLPKKEDGTSATAIYVSAGIADALEKASITTDHVFAGRIPVRTVPEAAAF